MTDALIGFTGFVGSNLARQHSFAANYNSSNIADIRGRKFNTLVFAGARAVKWWANQNADEDWAGIETAISNLESVQADRVILISTIDVLPGTGDATEKTDCSTFENHAYGTNRLRLEVEFKNLFGNVTIVRLPGLFGPGLKKNIIFDLLNDNMLDKIEPRSRFQFYDLGRLWGDIEITLENRIPLMHLFPEPVSTGEILDAFFPTLEVGSDPLPVASYNMKTRYEQFFGGDNGYIYSKAETLDRLGHYIRSVRGADAT